MWRRMFFADRNRRLQALPPPGEKVVVEEPFGPLMGRGTSSGGVVAGVDAQTAIDQRVRVMVAEVYVQPMTGANQRRIEGAALAGERIEERTGVGAVVFVVDPYVFAASPALVGITGIGRVAEVHHTQRLGASIVQLIEVGEQATRQIVPGSRSQSRDC